MAGLKRLLLDVEDAVSHSPPLLLLENYILHPWCIYHSKMPPESEVDGNTSAGRVRDTRCHIPL